jgi:hypothetical protein
VTPLKPMMAIQREKVFTVAKLPVTLKSIIVTNLNNEQHKHAICVRLPANVRLSLSLPNGMPFHCSSGNFELNIAFFYLFVFPSVHLVLVLTQLYENCNKFVLSILEPFD